MNDYRIKVGLDEIQHVAMLYILLKQPIWSFKLDKLLIKE